MDTLSCIICFALGLLIGSVYVDSGWKEDCLKIGSHVSQGMAFSCSER